MGDFKVESDFIYKGYTCVVVAQSLGHRCGYIGINEKNAFYEKDYDDMYEIEVHGGLTYAGGGNNSDYPIESNLWWFGFDCAHGRDANDLGIIKELNEGRNLDFLLTTSNHGTVRTLEYCIQECKNVVDQIIDMNEKEVKMVTITQKEYDCLVNSSKMLDALENNGVDNWCGFSDAQAEFNDKN